MTQHLLVTPEPLFTGKGAWLKSAFPDRRTLNVLLTILLVVTVCALVYSARRIIVIFIFAILFAYLLDPVVKFLQRHSLFFRNLRGPAVVEVYVAFVLLVMVAGYKGAPRIASNTVKLIDEIPVLLDGLSTGDIVTQLGDKYDWSNKQEVRFRAFLGRHTQDVQSVVQLADRYLSDAAAVLLCLVLIQILAIFFLRDGEHIAGGFIRLLIPFDRQAKAHAIAQQLHLVLTRYMRAQVLLCACSFAFYSAVLWLFSFPHAIALAVLGGLLEFIPVAGWTSTAAVILAVGMIGHSHWGWMAALLVLWRLIQDYFISPRLLGRELEMHPLAAIFAVLVGGEVGGIVGIYLAVPVIAAMQVILRGEAAPEPSRLRNRDQSEAASSFTAAVAD